MRKRKAAFERLEPRHVLAGQITGVAWQDVDADGMRDADEPVADGAVVYLDLNNSGAADEDEPTRVTDANGGYAFADLAAGPYVVRQSLTDGWVQTSPQATPRLAVINSDAEILTIRTTSGAVIQQVPIPVIGTSSETPRELTVDERGRIHIYNGTFDRQLNSTLLLLADRDAATVDNSFAGSDGGPTRRVLAEFGAGERSGSSQATDVALSEFLFAPEADADSVATGRRAAFRPFNK
ncbi:MAG TPA: SdrD B-like domain-containing protein [Lacipirellulaceae bacterium]|nr:SdrD B-like domain-containing protein [Lacipirellulaceae bacterium]